MVARSPIVGLMYPFTPPTITIVPRGNGWIVTSREALVPTVKLEKASAPVAEIVKLTTPSAVAVNVQVKV